jgi:hypothetical protein
MAVSTKPKESRKLVKNFFLGEESNDGSGGWWTIWAVQSLSCAARRGPWLAAFRGCKEMSMHFMDALLQGAQQNGGCAVQ